MKAVLPERSADLMQASQTVRRKAFHRVHDAVQSMFCAKFEAPVDMIRHDHEGERVCPSAVVRIFEASNHFPRCWYGDQPRPAFVRRPGQEVNLAGDRTSAFSKSGMTGAVVFHGSCRLDGVVHDLWKRWKLISEFVAICLGILPECS